MLAYHISTADHCRSIYSFLRNLLPSAPNSYLSQVLRSGHLSVNERCVRNHDELLLSGDTVRLKESARTRAVMAQPASPSMDILFEDQDIVVINKAAGLSMHAAAEGDSVNLVDMGTLYLAKRDGFPGKLRPINRLDKGTSGVVILGKGPSAAAIYGRIVKEEGLEKVYLAIVEGHPGTSGEITVPVEGKAAITRFSTLIQGRRHTLAAVYPVTGRMHQIRVHFSSLGHPVAGDKRYGARPLATPGFLLHSFRTSFLHPGERRMMRVHAPLPLGFCAMLEESIGGDGPDILRLLPELPQTFTSRWTSPFLP